jgi:ABC-type phosphate transport system ATPase subunit
MYALNGLTYLLTRQMFHKPVDPGTEDYVNGRFG